MIASVPRLHAEVADKPEEKIMPDIIKDTRYLRTKEAAHYVGLSARTLEKHRTFGTGPRYKKIGGRVIYTLEELRTWADRGSCASTSDPNNGNVSPPVRRSGSLDTVPAGHR